MPQKRRSATSSLPAMSASPLSSSPATPNRSRRFTPPRVHTMRSGVAASTRSQLSVAQLPALSPPLKKRMMSRRPANPLKLELPDKEEEERAVEEKDGSSISCCTYNSETETEEGDRTLLLITPDPYLPELYQRKAAVLRHGDTFYDALLTRARIHNNQSEFIALQALEYDKQFYLWTRAGRVGCAGKTTLTGPLPSGAEAMLKFCTSFASSTKCEWEERHGLRYQEGSYTWIELDYSTGTPYCESLTSALADNQGDMDNANSFRDFDLVPISPPPLLVTSSTSRKRRRALASASATSTTNTTTPTGVRRSLSTQFDWLYANSDGDTACATSSETSTCACATLPPSRLPTEVQEFLTLIADHAELSYADTVKDDLLGDAVMKLPLGRLSKRTIKRGYETLEEIYEALRSRQVARSRLTNLSSHFYSLIPHHSRLEVIDTMVKLGKQVQLMAEVGLSVRGLAHEPVARQCSSRNYLDECYDLLECTLQPVKSSDPDFALIQTYIRNSNCCGRKQDRLQLLSVFHVEKPEQETRFEPFRNFTNRRILWHGSHLANWSGILSEGLRIAPPEIASNGRTFGKGLYFTDKVTKAQAYCHCRPTNGHNQCVFALSEVALGKSKEMLNSDDSAKQFVHTGAGGRAKGAYYHSCKGIGSCRPDSNGEVVDIHGAIWPVGKPVQPEERTGLHHSEYIIYNPNQTRMRYVVLATSPY